MTLTLKTLTLNVQDNGIAEITLTRAHKCNAFNTLMVDEFMQIFEQCEHNQSIKIVVLRAEGKYFCAGADLNDMQASIDATFEENMADAKRLSALFFTLHHLRQPTIALVQGDCFAGGVGLVACCDVVIASEAAHFCISEVKLGLLPAVISPYIVRAMGKRQAHRYCVTAELMSAHIAKQIGLIHEIASPEQLESTLDKLLQRLLNNSTQAMMQTKRLIDYVNGQPIDTVLRDNTANAIASARVSEDGQARLRAFLNKSQTKRGYLRFCKNVQKTTDC